MGASYGAGNYAMSGKSIWTLFSVQLAT
jgi:acetyl-CoA carboxylase carboxyltransferase component